MDHVTSKTSGVSGRGPGGQGLWPRRVCHSLGRSGLGCSVCPGGARGALVRTPGRPGPCEGRISCLLLGECVSCSVTRLWWVLWRDGAHSLSGVTMATGWSCPWVPAVALPSRPRGGVVPLYPPPAAACQAASLPSAPAGLPPRLQWRLQEVMEAGGHTSRGEPFMGPGTLLKLGHLLFGFCARQP